MNTNILIVGVGGQGTLLASVLLGNLGPEEQVHSRESPLCSGLVMV